MSIFSLTGILDDSARRVRELPLQMGDAYDGFARPTLATRTSRSCRLDRAPDTDWLFVQLEDVVRIANEHYGFRLDGLEDFANIIQYEVGSKLDWHTDTHEDAKAHTARKVSVSVQLSDPSEYVGGDIEFAAHPTDPFSKVFGTAIVFPSYAAHRVLEVTSGKRLALVVFAHGPQFK
jgi:PKHD-type hydroxylase